MARTRRGHRHDLIERPALTPEKATRNELHMGGWDHVRPHHHEGRRLGRSITDEINADPEEARRLRRARRQARNGELFSEIDETVS